MTKQRSASPSKASADVGAVLDHGLLQVDEVGRLQRVGLVVGERAVELEVHRHDVSGSGVQLLLAQHRRHGIAGHAVAGVDNDLQRPDAG